MSYILEALKRAEQERTQSRPAEVSRDDDGMASTRLRPTTIALAGATLFLAGIGVATLLMRPTVATTPAPVTATAAPVAAENRSAPKSLPKVSPAAADEADAAAVDDAPTATYESLDDVAPVFQGTAGPTTAVTPTPAAQPLATPIPLQPSIAATPTTSQPQLAPPQVTTTPTTANPGRALPPTLRQMPAEFRARFPELLVQVHVFDTNPSRRWLMIDNRRYGEGAQLDAGPQILEILPDGAVFEFGGQPVLWPLNR